MKRILLFIASAILSATALAQLTQPPGGITGNTGGWAGGNGTSGQILTSRGVNLAPTFQTAPAGGSVTSVGLTVPSWETVSGSPVTTSGTLAVTAASGQTANSFLATPNGSTGAVTLRTIAAADLPALGANPSALVGTTAVNGTATTYIRSDAAPALDQTMSPATLSGSWTWSAASNVTINSTNTVTVGAALVNGGRFGVTSTTRPTNGIAAGAANTTVIAANGSQAALFNSNGRVDYNGWLVGGTKFTTSGCSVSSTTGGATAGILTLGANTCTVVVTMNGATGMSATNGWTCQAHDRNNLAVLIDGEASSTTTTASFTIPATAGTTDVISFSCVGY